MTAEDAIHDELVSWPAIVSATVDPQAQTATVILDPDMEDRLTDAVEVVRDLGFPAVEVLRRA
ncbi:cation transporter [Kocuria turfanensis]|uniref:cation transporter n=1 Tax=Kocuria turfanensis TaxID=388357 RepID=UPI0007869001|nr:cation transporter [Kocuria turfanensis]